MKVGDVLILKKDDIISGIPYKKGERFIVKLVGGSLPLTYVKLVSNSTDHFISQSEIDRYFLTHEEYREEKLNILGVV